MIKKTILQKTRKGGRIIKKKKSEEERAFIFHGPSSNPDLL